MLTSDCRCAIKQGGEPLTDQQRMPGDGFATKTASTSNGGRRRSTGKRRPGQSNHGRERCPLGRDPGFEAICSRQTLSLPLSGRLDAQTVKRAHKRLAVQHHPDKGGDPEMMTRLNQARDVLLQPEMEAIAA